MSKNLLFLWSCIIHKQMGPKSGFFLVTNRLTNGACVTLFQNTIFKHFILQGKFRNFISRILAIK
jgi:hypothetical protein